MEHDYGKILLNSDGTCEFKFTNTGDTPLVLTEVKATCGCTVPEWTKGMIEKGQEGVIKVKYNTRLPGSFNKSIMIYTNGSEDPVVLRIKGMVVKEGDGT